MDAIAISFSLKGQNFDAILSKLSDIADNNDAILIHGNLPRHEVIKRRLSTDLVDKLDELFPIQLNMWNEKVLRPEMGEMATKLNAQIYVIGQVIGGVAEEVKIYKSNGLNIDYLPIQ